MENLTPCPTRWTYTWAWPPSTLSLPCCLQTQLHRLCPRVSPLKGRQLHCGDLTHICIAKWSPMSSSVIPITSQSYHFVFVWWEHFKIYSLSKVWLYNTVFLTTVTMLYIRSPELTHIITRSSSPWTSISSFPPSLALATTIPSLCFSFWEWTLFRIHMKVRSTSVPPPS